MGSKGQQKDWCLKELKKARRRFDKAVVAYQRWGLARGTNANSVRFEKARCALYEAAELLALVTPIGTP